MVKLIRILGIIIIVSSFVMSFLFMAESFLISLFAAFFSVMIGLALIELSNLIERVCYFEKKS